MKIHILADLHLNLAPMMAPQTDADLIILAGDIDRGVRGLEWIHSNFPNRTVAYVLGNHEFYGHDLMELKQRFKVMTEGTNVGLLEHTSIDLGGFTFLGCTLWTDFMLRNNAEHAMSKAEELMNDFRLITIGGQGKRLRARDVLQLHKESVSWLRGELAKHDPATTVVVTHHAPSSHCEASQHVGSPLSPAFIVNLDELIKSSGVPLWIHGHTHHNVDFRLGKTRVLSNQRGYPSDKCPRFDPALVVQL